jgi:DNA-binding protein HU-beta
MISTKTNKKSIALKIQENIKKNNPHHNLSFIEAQICINTVLEEIINGVTNDGQVRLDSFGYICAKRVAERRCRNPRTNQPMIVPEHKVVAFKASKLFTDKINGKL